MEETEDRRYRQNPNYQANRPTKNYSTRETNSPPKLHSGNSKKRKEKPAQRRGFSGGFYFKVRRDRLDWRLLSAVNLNTIVRDVDVEALQEIMENVTFCDIEAEDLRDVDPNIVKIFQVSQLIIEYLLYSQEYLIKNKDASNDNLNALKETFDILTKKSELQAVELSEAKRETKRLKKTLYAYELLSKMPNGFGNNQLSVASYHKCDHCPKAFNNSTNLSSHIQRRHPEHYHPIQSPSPVAPVLQHPQPRASSPQQDLNIEVIEKISNTMERFSMKMVDTERQIRAEMEVKLNNELSQRQENLEKLYKNEQLRYEKEIQDLKTSIHREFNEEKVALKDQKEMLEKLMKAKPQGEISNVGKLEDDNSSVVDSVNNDKKDNELDILKVQMNEMKNSALQEKLALEARILASSNTLKELQDAFQQLKSRSRATSSSYIQEQKLDEAHEVKVEVAPPTFSARPSLVNVTESRSSIIDNERVLLEERIAKERAHLMDLENKERLQVLEESWLIEKQGMEEKLERERKEREYQQELIKKAKSDEEMRASLQSKQDLDHNSASAPIVDDWPTLYKALQSHNETPMANAPWIKSQFIHSPLDIAHQRTIIENKLEKEMAKLGIKSNDTIESWGHTSYAQTQLTKATEKFDEYIGDKKKQGVAYKNLIDFSHYQIVNIVTGHYKPKPFIKIINSALMNGRGSVSSTQPPMKIVVSRDSSPQTSPRKSSIKKFRMPSFSRKKPHVKWENGSSESQAASEYTESSRPSSPGTATDTYSESAASGSRSPSPTGRISPLKKLTTGIKSMMHFGKGRKSPASANDSPQKSSSQPDKKLEEGIGKASLGGLEAGSRKISSPSIIEQPENKSSTTAATTNVSALKLMLTKKDVSTTVQTKNIKVPADPLAKHRSPPNSAAPAPPSAMSNRASIVTHSNSSGRGPAKEPDNEPVEKPVAKYLTSEEETSVTDSSLLTSEADFIQQQKPTPAALQLPIAKPSMEFNSTGSGENSQNTNLFNQPILEESEDNISITSISSNEKKSSVVSEIAPPIVNKSVTSVATEQPKWKDSDDEEDANSFDLSEISDVEDEKNEANQENSQSSKAGEEKEIADFFNELGSDFSESDVNVNASKGSSKIEEKPGKDEEDDIDFSDSEFDI